MQIQTDDICALCGNDFCKLEMHHIQYIPEEIIIPLCKKCHSKIHHGNKFQELKQVFEYNGMNYVVRKRFHNGTTISIPIKLINQLDLLKKTKNEARYFVIQRLVEEFKRNHL